MVIHCPSIFVYKHHTVPWSQLRVCVCLYPFSTVTPLVQEESRTAHHVCLIFHLCQTHRPPCPSLFVSTDSRLALNIHGGCQPLAHTKAGPGPRGLGQGGWRSRAHAERDSQACAYVYAREREKERETLSSPFISVSQWDQGAAVERKEGGSKGPVCALEHACTHICRPLGRRVTHKHPCSPLSQRRKSHTECSSYHGSLMPSHTHTHIHTYVRAA